MSLESPDQDYFECCIYSTCASTVPAAFTVLLYLWFYTTVKIPWNEYGIT